MREDFYRLHWVAKVYFIFALLLMPWIVFLSFSLPSHHFSHHWGIMWVGFDIGLWGMLLLTAWGAHKNTWWLPIASTATSTLLIADAWFDMFTARTSSQFIQSVLAAGIIEVPLAVLTFWVSWRRLAKLR